MSDQPGRLNTGMMHRAQSIVEWLEEVHGLHAHAGPALPQHGHRRDDGGMCEGAHVMVYVDGWPKALACPGQTVHADGTVTGQPYDPTQGGTQ